MALTNALPEPRKPYVVGESRDPFVVVRSLAYQFGALSVELKAAVGIRDQLYYGILKDAYWIGTFFKECPDQYHRFKNDEYWRDVRRKPNDSNIMRSVLSRVMCAKMQESLQNRACKYARVLESFYQQDLLPDDVPQRLKDGGGIDTIYAALCRDAGPPEGRGDGREEPVNALPLTRTANGTTDGASDTSAVAIHGPSAAGEIHGDGDDDRGLADEHRRKSPVGSKRGPHDRIDLYTTLAVEMSKIELKEVLRARCAMIRIIIGPRDDGGWVPVRALSVLPSSSDEQR
jgi:hypothetical protein